MSRPDRPVLTLPALTALRHGMRTARTRAAILKDPAGWLARQGHRLPKGAGVEVGVRDSLPGSATHAISARFTSGNVSPRAPWPGLEAWWASTHGGCPLGTWPYTSKRKETVCDAYVLTYTGKEWRPAGEGTPFGRWEHTGVTAVCILSHEEEVEVTECLPGPVGA